MGASKLIRGLSIALLSAFGIVIAGGVISLLGVRFMGAMRGFEGWLVDHRFHLLAWRIVLYGATLMGWRWMRRRLLLREPDAATRFRRCELSALAVIFALESALWISSS
jgi:hypothetical protein